ncbi:helix-turn-helix domain-containing protein [Gemmatimonas sp.]|uniref:helix-turn-helix domain-containing protein n=1 Tax=Gemmatimonas sp. TaxID=1962908 RepID=UPI00286D05A7|nr:helix-turn-helix domain-containing protein [Gemmatimonas sp.]
MQYVEWNTRAATDDRVRCCWTLCGVDADGEPAEPALPDGCPELIFNFGDPFEHVSGDGTRHAQPSCFLVGQITAPFVVRPTGSVDLLAVRFEAHGAMALHADLSKLTNTWADAARLRDATLPALWRTMSVQDDDQRRATLLTWLARYGHAPSAADHVVRELVHAIRADGARRDPTPSVQALADAHGVSLRTVQRRFLTQVGVSPKRFSRIVRFHRVCLAWRHEPDTLARVAADCGYYDESHLVRDFRAFVGEPPAGFLNSLAAFTTLFLSRPRR